MFTSHPEFSNSDYAVMNIILDHRTYFMSNMTRQLVYPMTSKTLICPHAEKINSSMRDKITSKWNTIFVYICHVTAFIVVIKNLLVYLPIVTQIYIDQHS